jgi:hypothetical protein
MSNKYHQYESCIIKISTPLFNNMSLPLRTLDDIDITVCEQYKFRRLQSLWQRSSGEFIRSRSQLCDRLRQSVRGGDELTSATRKSPPLHANDYKNQVKTGNDGKPWKSLPDKNDIFHWKPCARVESTDSDNGRPPSWPAKNTIGQIFSGDDGTLWKSVLQKNGYDWKPESMD